jgi:hypothetical protein
VWEFAVLKKEDKWHLSHKANSFQLIYMVILYLKFSLYISEYSILVLGGESATLAQTLADVLDTPATCDVRTLYFNIIVSPFIILCYAPQHTMCGYEVPSGMTLLQASYLYTYNSLRGVIFEVLPLSSYALRPMILSWNRFQCRRHIFWYLQYLEIFVPLR